MNTKVQDSLLSVLSVSGSGSAFCSFDFKGKSF